MHDFSQNETRRFDGMIGTGGIGSGAFFALEGDHTLGREETRMGHFIQRRDYCKLHIISHYVQTLSGACVQVYPIGCVGDDATGHALLDEIQDASIDTTFVKVLPGTQTLYCICLIYPDASGGNLTTNDSASSKVSPAMVDQASDRMRHYGRRGLALAVPEVPLATRIHLLRKVTEHHLFRVASFVSEEMAGIRRDGVCSHVDLLAINIDEAATFSGVNPSEAPENIAQRTVECLLACQPNAMLSMTAGRQGAWGWDGRTLHHGPPIAVDVQSTAGAGDAHLSGLLVGLAQGLAFDKAMHLASLTAAMSVTSKDTLHHGINPNALQAFAAQHGLKVPKGP